jgi:hypothetical protein
VRACSGWMRRQRGGGGRRGPTCLYAPLRARPMPTPPRARTASSPDPSQGRTDRDASSSSPAGPARPATTCSRCRRGVPLPAVPRSRWALERRLCLCVRLRAVLLRFWFWDIIFRSAPSSLPFLAPCPCSTARHGIQLLIAILAVISSN